MADDETPDGAPVVPDAALPLLEFLGVAVTPGPVGVVTVPLTEAVRGTFNPLHGGVWAVLADVACAAAVADRLDLSAQMPVTTDLHVRYLGQPRSGPVRAEAAVVHLGRSVAVAECEVTDGEGRTIGRVDAAFTLRPTPGS
jgi:uncharacterized protein (TIGR00369 family)